MRYLIWFLGLSPASLPLWRLALQMEVNVKQSLVRVSGVSTVCAGAGRGREVNACLSAQLFPRSKTLRLLLLLLYFLQKNALLHSNASGEVLSGRGLKSSRVCAQYFK